MTNAWLPIANAAEFSGLSENELRAGCDSKEIMHVVLEPGHPWGSHYLNRASLVAFAARSRR